MISFWKIDVEFDPVPHEWIARSRGEDDRERMETVQQREGERIHVLRGRVGDKVRFRLASEASRAGNVRGFLRGKALCGEGREKEVAEELLGLL